MAVPTGYQYQNHGNFYIFYFKNIVGVTAMSPGYVVARFLVLVDTFWVRNVPTLPREILCHVWRPNKSAESGVLFVLFST